MGDQQQPIKWEGKPSRRELGGKFMGHNATMVERKRNLGNRFTRWYYKFFYDGRPDVAGEKTRKEHWEKLHSRQRFIQAIFFYIGPPSHLFRNLVLPMTMIFCVTVFFATYYALKATHFPELPSFDGAGNMKTIFLMGSFAVALLLSTRIDRTYERWWLARESFGGVSVNTTQAGQLVAVWCEDEALVQKFINWMIVYHYSVMLQLLALPRLSPTAAELLGPEELAVVNASKKPRQLATLQAHELLKQCNFSMDKFIIIEELLNESARNGGACARVKFQAMPYNVSIISTGFVLMWLLVLPIGFFDGVEIDPNNVVLDTIFQFATLAIAFLIFAFLLLACDEISNQLEDPFYQLPLEDIAKVSASHLQRTVKEVKALRKARAAEEIRLKEEEESFKQLQSKNAATAAPYTGPAPPPL